MNQKKMQKNINEYIYKENPQITKLPKRSDFSWSSDGSMIAIGNKDGSIEIYSSSWKILRILHDHKKLINRLKWNPILSSQFTTHEESQCINWLASASEDSTIRIYDLSKLLKNSNISNKFIQNNTTSLPSLSEECVQILKGHTSQVSSLCWNIHEPTQLLSGSFDATAQENF
jgi:gem associated protein 5